jgi:hypothetical protein
VSVGDGEPLEDVVSVGVADGLGDGDVEVGGDGEPVGDDPLDCDGNGFAVGCAVAEAALQLGEAVGGGLLLWLTGPLLPLTLPEFPDDGELPPGPPPW